MTHETFTHAKKIVDLITELKAHREDLTMNNNGEPFVYEDDAELLFHPGGNVSVHATTNLRIEFVNNDIKGFIASYLSRVDARITDLERQLSEL